MIWPPMALKIGLLKSSALQNDGHIKPELLRRPILRAIRGQITFSQNPCFCFLHVPSLGIPSLTISRSLWVGSKLSCSPRLAIKYPHPHAEDRSYTVVRKIGYSHCCGR